MRPGFREVAPLRRDRFLTADIPISMHVHAGRCRAERFHAEPFHPLPGCQIDSTSSFLRRRLGCVHKRVRRDHGRYEVAGVPRAPSGCDAQCGAPPSRSARLRSVRRMSARPQRSGAELPMAPNMGVAAGV